ncbi:LOW QUALITY PROTEIN: U8 snoRNA-decapping enzyme-like [Haliotis rubra]|uniref:LOW QUALITY PROTEIN: U8 snoRNA-decapping enzyme-like n=1 Tax=Haliotis rubra TaxID=36100 RepID=UPI001EE5A417|nr:LOW QUALITY PROTEIN: U8 snoRNA-decapping enzyme-like [Haliotis rubra]
MEENNWGWLAPYEKFGRLGDTKDTFKTIEYSEAKTKYSSFTHASHGMLFARDDKVLWDLYKARGAVLMQMRFDGVIGFPGGLVEKGEDPVCGLNREMEEEICLDLTSHRFTDQDHVVSFLNEDKSLVLHFYKKEVSLEEFKALEIQNLQAPEYGIETYGIVRPPLFTMGDGLRGFPAFLANHFAGNAREELVIGLSLSNLLSQEEIQAALKASQTFQEQCFPNKKKASQT